MNKKSGKILGIVLVCVGIILAIIGVISFFSATGSMNPRGIFVGAGLGMILIFVGVLLLIIGGVIIYLASIGKIFTYVTTETALGVETASHALGKGLARGVKKGLKQK